MDRNRLRSYAKLIARMGVNVQPGQEVIIRTEPQQLEFLQLLTEECYHAGASKVRIEWRWQPALRLDIKYQDPETLGRVEAWEEERMRGRCDRLPADIYLDSDDPDGLAGVDQDKWAQAQQKRFRVIKSYRDRMENRYQWCVAAVPGAEWAKKVFPGLGEEEAVEKLWTAILRCSRAEGDPIAAWQEHNRELKRRCDWLNSLNLRRLIYKSELTGTDFSVGLMPQMRFMGGADVLAGSDVSFNANIPSEEVYTTPMKGEAEGIVCATRPLSYRGVLIEDFSIRFEKGRVTELHAKKNEAALRLMVSMDEGASMLGECALVPYHSPINDSGILFYSTLIDENASCHLALGDGYSSCLEDFDKYTAQEARALGVNESMIHEDFMIGSEDLSITGVKADGEEVRIFVNGSWAED
ncbi:MAG: aminopeptidase [Candidatus Limivicinus sp.]|jgi:aminopeptidase